MCIDSEAPGLPAKFTAKLIYERIAAKIVAAPTGWALAFIDYSDTLEPWWDRLLAHVGDPVRFADAAHELFLDDAVWDGARFVLRETLTTDVEYEVLSDADDPDLIGDLVELIVERNDTGQLDRLVHNSPAFLVDVVLDEDLAQEFFGTYTARICLEADPELLVALDGEVLVIERPTVVRNLAEEDEIDGALVLPHGPG